MVKERTSGRQNKPTEWFSMRLDRLRIKISFEMVGKCGLFKIFTVKQHSVHTHVNVGSADKMSAECLVCERLQFMNHPIQNSQHNMELGLLT